MFVANLPTILLKLLIASKNSCLNLSVKSFWVKESSSGKSIKTSDNNVMLSLSIENPILSMLAVILPSIESITVSLYSSSKPGSLRHKPWEFTKPNK